MWWCNCSLTTHGSVNMCGLNEYLWSVENILYWKHWHNGQHLFTAAKMDGHDQHLTKHGLQRKLSHLIGTVTRNLILHFENWAATTKSVENRKKIDTCKLTLRPRRVSKPSSSNAPRVYSCSMAVMSVSMGGASMKSNDNRSLMPIAWLEEKKNYQLICTCQNFNIVTRWLNIRTVELYL